jgi:hypothetical protein
MKMHNHLLHLRNTMIAHDDFDEIAPRILTFGLCFDKRGIGFVPTSIVISNKCLSFPVHACIVKEMHGHAQAALQGIHAKLQEDMSLLRKTIIKNPGVAIDKAKYTKNYGRAEIPAQKAPDFSNDEWLNAKVPDYSSVHGGFVYEETRIMSNFHGPETITLPDGHTVEISPNQM